MIAYIRGKLTYKCPTYVILETSGVGYHIQVSLHTYTQITTTNIIGCDSLMLYTYLCIKEDAHTLYGFVDESERRLFQYLISVSGIGTNTARMMLSSITPLEIEQAIVSGDVVTIQRIKGIGAKTAQRLILELKDKMEKEFGQYFSIQPVSYNASRDEALSALVMLGIAKNTAEKSIDKILKQQTTEISVEKLIKAVLKSI
jgi:Holliday junction DNA helicase RuvA